MSPSDTILFFLNPLQSRRGWTVGKRFQIINSMPNSFYLPPVLQDIAVNQDRNMIGTGLSFQSSNNPLLDAYYKANPFVGQTYKRTLVDKLFGSIFRTPEEKWREEMALNAAQYDASVVDLGEQLQYNSEAAKSDRMRAAGLNPDMLGIGDASTSPGLSPDTQDAQLPEPADPLNVVSSVIGGVLNLIPQTLSFMQGIQSFRLASLDLDSKELQFSNSALDAAIRFFTEGVSKNDWEDAINSGSYENIITAANSHSKSLSESLFSSKRARQRFNKLYGVHSHSLLAELSKFKTFDDFEAARKSLFTKQSSAMWSPDDDAMKELIAGFTQPLEKYNKRISEILLSRSNLRNPEREQTLENQQISNQLAYETEIDPTLQAKAENAANERTAQEADIMTATNDLFEEIMTFLKSKDNVWSSIGMALVGIARAQVLSGIHASFGRNSHYTVNGDTGVYTEQGNSSFNLNL